MGFDTAVVGLVLFSYISQMEAFSFVEMEDPDFDVGRGRSAEKFKVHLSESGAHFNEKIYIDKKKDIEYFKVPPHNKLSETDNMYDFKMNITVSRSKKDRYCHISPLPADLPRPRVLSKGLKSLSHRATSHNIEKIIMQWRVGPKVDKSTLRKEVRDFCGSFPVYRLLPFTLDSVSVGNGGRDKRVLFKTFPLCDNFVPPCTPDRWIFSCKIKTDQCMYYVSCYLDAGGLAVRCESVTKHLYHGLVCCRPTCKYNT